ncbi:hypothetical protein [Rubrivivax gelatinosus]|uniref:Uncharacterized protein n=1 Tax=Rubrivivax gelatinosus TaxID=28068 RepID=A0A4R2MAI9_RUBGE|nr:hypothetical protein [Rubrivivax gelatinosus]MBK1686416.1 hypothetical protein [Rubrivivax gelatinosus]TCP04359.1 hypothetical protein EV684_102112 [Rubrivivax gelatinosus]
MAGGEASRVGRRLPDPGPPEARTVRLLTRIGYGLWVPGGCAAAEAPGRNPAALDWLALALKCRVQPAWR